MSPRHCERSDLSAIALAKAEAIQSGLRCCMDCFVASLLAMTWRGRNFLLSPRSQSAVRIQIAQLALENLSGGFARHCVQELDILGHFEIGELSAQEFLHGGRRQRGIRFRFDAGEQALAELVV